MKRQEIFVSLPHVGFRQLRYKEIRNAEPDIKQSNKRIIMDPCIPALDDIEADTQVQN